jgi:predicted unusual protein kinase regulating ubiquinone biosynthesis (AarF/ABC1/UbiB family)
VPGHGKVERKQVGCRNSHVVSVIEEELGKPIDQIFSYVESRATVAASLG